MSPVPTLRRALARLVVALAFAVIAGVLTPTALSAQGDPGDVIASTGPGGLYVYAPDGSNGQLLVAGNYLRGPWSPDGAWLAYQPWNGSAYEVWAVRADGTEAHYVATGTTWSWVDDTRVAVQPWGSAGFQAVDVVTGATEAHVFGPGIDYVVTHPRYSPDGTALAYSRLRDDGSDKDVVIRDLATGTEQLIAEGASTPAWSPDGSLIAWAENLRNDGTGGLIWVANADGSDRRAVSSGMEPTFSPAGDRLVFWRDHWWPTAPDTDVYTVGIWGEALTQIQTSGYPQWRPGPAGPPDREGLAVGDTFATETDAVSTVTVVVSRQGDLDGTAAATLTVTPTRGAAIGALTQVVTFAPGQRTAAVSVTITGNDLDEDDHLADLTLSNVSGAEVYDGASVLRVADDEVRPQLQAVTTELDVMEPATETDYGLEVTLSAPSARTFTLSTYAGSGPGCSDTFITWASQDEDFRLPSEAITIPPGETRATVPLTILPDSAIEGMEISCVQLFGFDGTGGDSVWIPFRIEDDEAPRPVVGLAGTTVTEGDGDPVEHGVELAIPSYYPNWLPFQYTITPITGSADDLDRTSGWAYLPPGQLSLALPFGVIGDELAEPAETFLVELAAWPYYVVSNSATITVLDDDTDGPVVMDVGDVTVAEGAGSVTVPVTLSRPAAGPVNFTVATANGTARATYDYGRVAPVVMEIPAGASSTSVVVTVVGDTVDETDETFRVVASAVSGAEPGDLSATVTVSDDDDVTIAPVATMPATLAVDERNTRRAVRVPVTLNYPPATDQAFAVTLAAGTATAGVDFAEAATSTLTIAAGRTSGFATFDVLGDRVREPDETLTVSLAPLTEATVAGSTEVVLVDDDVPFLTLGAPASVVERDSGTRVVTFRARLSAASPFTVTASYASGEPDPAFEDPGAPWVLATAAEDYDPVAGMLTFAPGQVEQTITVVVHGDEALEPNETFAVCLADLVEAQLRLRVTPGGANAPARCAMVTITNDD